MFWKQDFIQIAAKRWIFTENWQIYLNFLDPKQRKNGNFRGKMTESIWIFTIQNIAETIIFLGKTTNFDGNRQTYTHRRIFAIDTFLMCIRTGATFGWRKKSQAKKILNLKKFEKEKNRENSFEIFFFDFPKFVEIIHMMSRLQNNTVIGQGVPEISVRTDTYTNYFRNIDFRGKMTKLLEFSRDMISQKYEFSRFF